jgi:DNA polymerase-3 subunit delta
MILLLHGSDALAIRRRMQAVRDDADGGSGMLMTNQTFIDGRDAKPGEILAQVMSPPFLAPKRLVIVENLLDRFEQSGDQRQPRSLEPLKALLDVLEQGIPPTTVLVFTGGALKRNTLLDRLKRLPEVEDADYAAPERDNLFRFVRDEAAARGLKFRNGPFKQAQPEDEEIARISDPAVLLATLLRFETAGGEWHSDTLSIVNELDKLALYTMGREATVDEVYASCAGQRESNRFAFSDAVMDGDLRKALQALALLRRDGESPLALLGLLITGYRMSATVIDLLDDGATPEEIGKAIRRPWPNLRDRAIRRARGLGPAGLKAAYAALVAADRTHKAGEVDEDIAMEILVEQLAALAGTAAPGGRR